MKQAKYIRLALSALVAAALSAACSAPALINGKPASLNLAITLDAAFTQALPDGARFLLPEMSEVFISAKSLNPLVIADLSARADVAWDAASGTARANATIYGLPVDTPLRIVVEGFISKDTVATRAEAEITIPSDAPSASLALKLQPTANFPMDSLSPGAIADPVTIAAGTSKVFTFNPGSLVGSPAFFGWSFPQATALQASLRLMDGTLISLSPKGDGSGLNFTPAASDPHYLIIHNPGNQAAKLGSVVVADDVFVSMPALSVPSGLTKNFGDAPFSLNPSSDSGGAFSFATSDASVAAIDATTGLVTIAGIGSATLSVSQSAYGFWESPSTVTCYLTVAGIPPTIGAWSIAPRTFAPSLSFTLTQPTSNSSGAFSYASDNPAVAYVSGTNVTVIGAGSALITATQAPSGGYDGGSVSATLVVGKGTPVIESFPPLSMTMADSSKTLYAPTVSSATPSTGGITYSIVTGSSITLSDPISGLVQPAAVGVTTVLATLAPDANWEGTSASTDVTVQLAPASISGLPGTITKTYGDPAFDLTIDYPFTSPNPQPFGYSTSDAAVAGSDGYGMVTIYGAGICTITVNQPSNGIYEATSMTIDLMVNKAIPVITGVTPTLSLPLLSGTHQLTPSSSGGGMPTYTSSNPSIATVDPAGKITFVAAGNVQIHIQYPETANYQSALFIVDLTIIP